MRKAINRREWLKQSALLTGGATLLPGALNQLQAAPVFKKAVTNSVFNIRNTLPLKARLFANENPFGPSDKVKKVIADTLSISYQYDFAELADLKKQIAAYEGLTEDHILLAPGSSPLLTAAAAYFSRNGGNVISCDPTFDVLPINFEDLEVKWIKLPLKADYSFDLNAINNQLNSGISLVYIVNPNNPTGTVLDTNELKTFCSAVSKKIPVFVDEAYIDYLPDPKGSSVISNIKNGENIIVSRTFSKIYGLAGMRIGYCVALPEMIKTLAKFNTEILPTPSLKAAMTAYMDADFMSSALEKTNASKTYLYDVLKNAGYPYVPSVTNFVIFPVKMDSKKFVDEMMARAVGVRYWKFNDQEWCRVSIGRMDEMKAFETAFKEVIQL